MDLTSTFDRFHSLSVLVIGDVMLDRYIHGAVTRVSPEAPVPVVEWNGQEDRPGGAANVAVNIQALGATAYVCAVTGQDEEAGILADLLEKEGIRSACISSENRTTTIKTRIIAGNQHLLRLDREDTADLNREEEDRLIRKVKDILLTVNIDVVIFQDYNKGVLTGSVIDQLISIFTEYSIPMAVDPKFRNFWKYKGVTLFKPNLKEIRDALPFRVDPDLNSLKKAAGNIREKLQNRHTLITLSEKGIFMDDPEHGFLLPTHPRNVADVCGAGDGVISIAALGLALELPMDLIALLANLAGGQIVEKVGVVPIDRQKLLDELRTRTARQTEIH